MSAPAPGPASAPTPAHISPVDEVVPGHASRTVKLKRLNWLDNLLALWIVLAMALGIILGYFVPNTSVVLQKVEFVNVSLPLGKPSLPRGPRRAAASMAPAHASPRRKLWVCASLAHAGADGHSTRPFVRSCDFAVAAIALIVMMWPILCRVSPLALARLFKDKRIWYHLAFSLVVNWIVAPLLMLALAWAFLPDREELRTGLILVGIARCIAMVSLKLTGMYQSRAPDGQLTPPSPCPPPLAFAGARLD